MSFHSQYLKLFSILFFFSASVIAFGQETTYTDIEFTGVFGGTSYDGNNYIFPSGSEPWGGFANEDVSIYPLTFSDGGEITFTGSTSGAETEIYFRFEYNPYPDTEPSFNTSSVVVSGMDEAFYSVEIPSQGANTYSSFLLYATTLNSPVSLTDVTLSTAFSSTDVYGCTDSTASNYNPNATFDDGSCENGSDVSQIDLPVTFEDATIDYTMADFGGNVSSLVNDPYDANNMVMQVVKTSQAATWAGTTIGTSDGFFTDIPLTLTDSKMFVRVWSPAAGTPIRLKVEDSTDATHTCETESNTTVSGGWEVVEFNFLNQAPGTELLSIGLGMGWTYNMASIFFNFGTEGYATGETTYYFDDVLFGGLVADDGCTDDEALNYNSEANQDDGSCHYDIDFVNNTYDQGYSDGVDSVICLESNCPGDLTMDDLVSTADLLFLLIQFGTICQ